MTVSQRAREGDEPGDVRLDHRVPSRSLQLTDIVAERGDDGMARIQELTRGVGADATLECVGTQQAMMQAIRLAARS